jgi:hypothetical protein
VHHSHTLGRRCVERRARSGSTLLVGEQSAQAAAAEMVCFASEQPVRAISDCLRDIRKLIKKGGGDYCGVDVHPGQVDRYTASGSVELASGRGHRFGPCAFIPALADDDVRIRMMTGVGCDPLDGVIPTSHIVQTKARHDLASLDQMRVRVDKCGGKQPSTKINFGLPGSCGSGRLIGADEADELSVGYDSSCSRVVRSVEASPDEDHKLVRDEGFNQICGRSSNGIERTVVVSVDTLAAVRIRPSVDSRCAIVGA